MDFQEERGSFDFSRRQLVASFCQVLRTFDRERQKKEKANEADLLKRLEEDKGTRKNTEEE